MSEQRQRSGNVRIRLTADEESAIRAKASAAGVSVSAFVRAAALGRKVPTPPAALVAGLANLGRLGELLRLALVQLESGSGSSEARGALAATLAALRRAADEVRAQLR